MDEHLSNPKSEDAKLKTIQKKHQTLMKAHNRLLVLWEITFIGAILILVTSISLIQLKNKLIAQINNTAELRYSITKLSNEVMYTPFLLEKYMFTLDSLYLQKYWRTIQLNRSIENLMFELTKFTQFKEQITQLETDLNTLREEEIHALKLFLLAYQIPTDIINPRVTNFELSKAETSMPLQEQLKEAHQILFNNKRQDLINASAKTILLLRNEIYELQQKDIQGIEHYVFLTEIVLIALTILEIILILSILWLRLINKIIFVRMRTLLNRKRKHRAKKGK